MNPDEAVGPGGSAVRVDARETDAQRLARIRRNLAKLQQAGAAPEEVQAYVESERITPADELAHMPRTKVDEAAGGVQAALQGLTFNFGDEIAGGIDGLLDPNKTMGEAIGEQRASLEGFREAHPKTALGLELAGGLASGIATAGVGMAGRAPTIGRIAGVTAAGGALAGAGAGEGLAGRAKGAAVGGVLGAGLGAGGARLLRTGAARHLIDFLESQGGNSGQDIGNVLMTRSGPATRPNPVAANIVASSLGDETGSMAPARTILDELEAAGMGDEMLALNLGGDPAARSARALANVPSVPFARTNAKGVLDEALAKQGGALGELVPADINVATGLGGRPGPIVFDEMAQARRAQAGELYGRARAEADQYFAGQRMGAGMPERAMNQPKALPGPGESVSAKRDLPDMREPVPQVGVPPRVRRETISQEMGREALETRRPSRLNPDGSRPVNLRAANDVNVRREFEPPVQEVPVFEGRDFREVNRLLQRAADDPVVAQSVASVRQTATTPEIADGTADDFDILAAAYHDITAQIRALKSGPPSAQATRELSGLTAAARKADEALSLIAPTWKEANAAYRFDSEGMEAFTRGQELPTSEVGESTLALRDAPSDEARAAMRTGAATKFQTQAMERASNKDLGELARFRDAARPIVDNPADRERFIELFGRDAYTNLLGRLSPKIRAAAQNAAVRGNSTTARQLLDAMALGDDAVLSVLESTSRGGIGAGMANAGGKFVFQPLRALLSGQAGRTSEDAARLFATRGADANRTLLDMLEELGQAEMSRQASSVPVTGAVGRTVTPEMRGNPR